MTFEERAKEQGRISKFNNLEGALERAQLVVEDLKYETGTLRIDVGGGRATFQTHQGSDVQHLREILIEAFRNRVHKLKCEMADL
jgi:hypothetical protein